jgi:hypothetical protein
MHYRNRNRYRGRYRNRLPTAIPIPTPIMLFVPHRAAHIIKPPFCRRFYDSGRFGFFSGEGSGVSRRDSTLQDRDIHVCTPSLGRIQRMSMKYAAKNNKKTIHSGIFRSPICCFRYPPRHSAQTNNIIIPREQDFTVMTVGKNVEFPRESMQNLYCASFIDYFY